MTGPGPGEGVVPGWTVEEPDSRFSRKNLATTDDVNFVPIFGQKRRFLSAIILVHPTAFLREPLILFFC